jgi:alpha-tubulin suppressor-like RCC1 family protein
MKKIILILFPIIAFGQCWQSLDAGTNHVLAIKTDGTLWSWGNNDHIKLGWNNATPSSSPGIVNNNTNWISASAGYMHSAAINSNGKLFTWGNNTYGECGDGRSGIQYAANSIRQIGNDNWAMVSCGSYYTLLIKSDGTLWSTGDNTNGKCGRGTLYSNTPAQIGTDSNWKQVSANGTYSLGLKTDGTLWFWGYGYQGNGSGNTTSNTPIQVGTDTDWNKIATRNTFAIKLNGTLWGWGSNNNGVLGNGSNASSFIPIQIGADTNWKTVTGNISHVMAKKEDDTLWIWGNNSYGQFGNGTFNNNLIPSQYEAATNWSFISAGQYFSTALNSDGTIFSCGINSYGQLGIGNNIIMSSNVNTFTPVVCTTLNTDTFLSNVFKIYPNPSSKILLIENNTNAEIQNIIVTDLTGKIVLKTANNFSELNIEPLESGIYLISITVDNKSYSYKFIKK